MTSRGKRDSSSAEPVVLDTAWFVFGRFRGPRWSEYCQKMPVKGLNDPRVTLLHVPITRFEWVVVETAFLTTHPAGGGHAVFAKTTYACEASPPQ